MLKQYAALKRKKKSSKVYNTNFESLKVAGSSIDRQKDEEKKRTQASLQNNLEMMEEDKNN